MPLVGRRADKWQAIRRLTDSYEPIVQKAILRDLAALRGAVNIEALAVSLGPNGSRAQAEALLARASTSALQLHNSTAILEQTLWAGGHVGAAGLDASLSFDTANPYAIRAAHHRGATLVKQVSGETKKAIREVISRAYETGRPPRESAKEIHELVGLTSRQAARVSKVRALMLATGKSAEQADKLAGKVAAKLRKDRALNIARTETINAANRGQLEAWGQLQREGVLTPDVGKEWITTPDDRRCLYCQAMDGQVVPLGEPFLSTRYGKVQGPTLHPRCRCAMGVAKLAKVNVGAHTPTHPWLVGAPEPPKSLGLTSAADIAKWKDEFDAKTRARLKAYRDAQKALKDAGKKPPAPMPIPKPDPVPDIIATPKGDVFEVDTAKVTWPATFKFPTHIATQDERVLFKAEFDWRTRQRLAIAKAKKAGLTLEPKQPPTFILKGQALPAPKPSVVDVPKVVTQPKVQMVEAGPHFRMQIDALIADSLSDPTPMTPELRALLDEARFYEKRQRTETGYMAARVLRQKRDAAWANARRIDRLAPERDLIEQAQERLTKALQEGRTTLAYQRQLKDAQQALEAAANSGEAARDAVLKLLETKPATFQVNTMGVLPKNQAMYDGAIADVRRFTGEVKGFDDTYRIGLSDKPGGKGGSYAHEGRNGYNRVIVMMGDGRAEAAYRDVLIHEFGHHVEFADPSALAKAKALLTKRSGPNPVMRLLEKIPGNQVSPDRQGTIFLIEDEWKKRGGAHYMGRLYVRSGGSKFADNLPAAQALRDVDATELISEGLARLVRDPVGFAKHDPEWFDLTMSVLRPNGVAANVGGLADEASQLLAAQAAARAAEDAARKLAAELAAKKAAERAAAKAAFKADLQKQTTAAIEASQKQFTQKLSTLRLADLDAEGGASLQARVAAAEKAHVDARSALDKALTEGLDDDAIDAIERRVDEAAMGLLRERTLAKHIEAEVVATRKAFDAQLVVNSTKKTEIAASLEQAAIADLEGIVKTWKNITPAWEGEAFDTAIAGLDDVIAKAHKARLDASDARQAFASKYDLGQVTLAELSDDVELYRRYMVASNALTNARESRFALLDLRTEYVAKQAAIAAAEKAAKEAAELAAQQAAEQAAKQAKAAGGTTAISAVDETQEIADAVAYAAKHGKSITGKPITWPDNFKFPKGIITEQDKLLYKAEFDTKTRIRLRKARGTVVTKHDKPEDATFTWPLRDDETRSLNDVDINRLDVDADWLRNSPAFTAEERKAMQNYASGSSTFNNYLRGKYGGTTKHTPNASMDKWERLLRQVMDKTAASGHHLPPRYVWRGVSGGDGRRVLGHLKKGDVLRVDGGFQCTSTSPSTAFESFSSGDDLRMEIVPARGVWLRKGASGYESEYEWTLDANSTFEVIGRKRIPVKLPHSSAGIAGPSHGIRMIEVVQLREIQDEAATAAREEMMKRAAKEAAEREAKEKAAKALAKAKHDALPDVSAWKQVGPQGGSNPGGVFQAPDGANYYVKFSQKHPEQANVEMLTDSIYRELGIGAKESVVIRKGDKVGLAGKMIEGSAKMSEAAMKASDDVLDGFVADAYLANWDVLGQGFDNVVAKAGKAYRIDTGGSMIYRAQGGLKEFSATAVDEIDSLRKYGGKTVFGGLTEERMKQQARILVDRLSPQRLQALVDKAGVVGQQGEDILAALNGRREYLRKRFNL